ncbi:MAG: type VI secretion system baseplate subunit TssF [Deltaproteobacteria bacterium]|jgi:type VI secretion system protein ImpG|nr:type VI secretion system baseplate subunit TssF [Deltaproteobacteria bacterium]
MTIKDYYQEELSSLRELAAEFSRAYPALAPMLAGQGDDPDVERLLEGVAFLSGLNRQRFEAGFPELIQSLLRLLFPQAIRPVPSFTLVKFQLNLGFGEAIHVPQGTLLDSIPVEGAVARFATERDLKILPAQVTKVKVQDAAGGARVTVEITFSSNLAKWVGDKISFFWGGDYPEASMRRGLFFQKVKEIRAGAPGREIRLREGAMRSAAWTEETGDLSESDLLASLSLLEDYFALPQKFLFTEIGDLKRAALEADRVLSLVFLFGDLRAKLPPLRPEHFLLNVVPAANVFPHPAIPINVDHRRAEYLLRPQGQESGKIAIFAVNSVHSVTREGKIRPYVPFETLPTRKEGEGAYSLSWRTSPVSGQSEHYLRVLYVPGEKPARETLSVSLLCHNQKIVDSLRTGEIVRPTDSSPAMATFGNIIPPTRLIPPAEDQGSLWLFFSRLHLSVAKIFTSRALKELLETHSFARDGDPGRRVANIKRVEAIASVKVEKEDYLTRGRPIRGSRVILEVDKSGFASFGDLLLFGDALSHYLGLFHQINTFARLVMVEKSSREVIEWNPRLGTRRLV